MNSNGMIIVIAVLGISTILFAATIAYLRTESFRKRFPNKLYRFTLVGHSWILSKHLLIKFGVLIFLYSWLDEFMPFPITVILVLVALLSLKIVEARTINTDTMTESSKELLEHLKKMQTEIGDIHQHIEGLSEHIVTKQIELNEKEKRRKLLEKEIEEKSCEVSEWESLTEKQKQLVIDSALDAISKESKGTFWWGLLLGFFVNILATLTWTLLGNPGKDEIIKKIMQLGIIH